MNNFNFNFNRASRNSGSRARTSESISIPSIITEESVDESEDVFTGRREPKAGSAFDEGAGASNGRRWKRAEEEAAQKVIE
jgi:hypothetical protein